MTSGSSPPLAPITNASDVAASETANRMLLVSFKTCAAPGLLPAMVTVGPPYRRSKGGERRQRDRDDFALIPKIPRRYGPARLTQQQRFHCCFADVEHDQAMARIHEFAGHRLAHVADTEISHLHRPSPLIDFRRARSCHRPAPLARRGFAEGPIHVLQSIG